MPKKRSFKNNLSLPFSCLFLSSSSLPQKKISIKFHSNMAEKCHFDHGSKVYILHKGNKKLRFKSGNKQEEVHASRQHLISFAIQERSKERLYT
jgi:hypothetical protein